MNNEKIIEIIKKETRIAVEKMKSEAIKICNDDGGENFDTFMMAVLMAHVAKLEVDVNAKQILSKYDDNELFNPDGLPTH